jgi:hypothetical protein
MLFCCSTLTAALHVAHSKNIYATIAIARAIAKNAEVLLNGEAVLDFSGGGAVVVGVVGSSWEFDAVLGGVAELLVDTGIDPVEPKILCNS